MQTVMNWFKKIESLLKNNVSSDPGKETPTMKADKLYPLADYGSVPGFRCIKGFRNWPPGSVPTDGEPRQYIAAKATGEYRPPKAREWYLSGARAIVEAYDAKHDFNSSFSIAKIVIVTVRPVLDIDSVEDVEGAERLGRYSRQRLQIQEGDTNK